MQKQLKASTNQIKEQLSNYLLLFGVIIGFIIFILIIFLSEYYLFTPSFYTDLVGLTLLLMLFIFRNKISYNVKNALVILLIYLIAQINLIQYGVISPLKMLFAMLPFISVLSFNLRHTLTLFAFILTGFSVTAYLFIQEVITPVVGNPMNSSVSLWISFGLVLTITGLIIMMFVNKYNERLDQIFTNLISTSEELTERDKQLNIHLKEKDVMLQEIHHRVKNNLAVVSGLLELQSLSVDDEKVKNTLQKSTNRILSIAKVHQMLYQSEKFDRIPFKNYVDELADVILTTMNSDNLNVSFSSKVGVEYLSINNGVPLGIIFNELMTNSIKYGFTDNKDNQIEINVLRNNGDIRVVYADNGVGISNFEEASTKSLGFSLIESLLAQLQAEFSYKTDDGFSLSFSYPENNA